MSARADMGEVSTIPTRIKAMVTAIALERGLNLTDEQIGDAAAFLARFEDELQILRSVDLPFLPPYPEPGTALRWIENGGRSTSRS
jgi:hypothetical protein